MLGKTGLASSGPGIKAVRCMKPGLIVSMLAFWAPDPAQLFKLSGNVVLYSIQEFICMLHDAHNLWVVDVPVH